jgi:hypothetical protein
LSKYFNNYNIDLQDDRACGNITTPTLNRRKDFKFEISDRLSQKKIYLEVNKP